MQNATLFFDFMFFLSFLNHGLQIWQTFITYDTSYCAFLETGLHLIFCGWKTSGTSFGWFLVKRPGFLCSISNWNLFILKRRLFFKFGRKIQQNKNIYSKKLQTSIYYLKNPISHGLLILSLNFQIIFLIALISIKQILIQNAFNLLDILVRDFLQFKIFCLVVETFQFGRGGVLGQTRNEGGFLKRDGCGHGFLR